MLRRNYTLPPLSNVVISLKASYLIVTMEMLHDRDFQGGQTHTQHRDGMSNTWITRVCGNTLSYTRGSRRI